MKILFRSILFFLLILIFSNLFLLNSVFADTQEEVFEARVIEVIKEESIVGEDGSR